MTVCVCDLISTTTGTFYNETLVGMGMHFRVQIVYKVQSVREDKLIYILWLLAVIAVQHVQLLTIPPYLLKLLPTLF